MSVVWDMAPKRKRIRDKSSIDCSGISAKFAKHVEDYLDFFPKYRILKMKNWQRICSINKCL